MSNNKLRIIIQNFALLSFTSLAIYSQNIMADENPDTRPKAHVALAHIPLHAAGTMDKPTMALALSVEYPTVGALYRDEYDLSDPKEYIGYFYSKGCYEYIQDKEDSKKSRFRFVKESSEKYRCSNSDGTGNEYFSGNFLNWASSSSIDMLRLALSGGDRFIDEDDFTVLQRAIIPAGNPQVACFWNHKMFFPRKGIKSNRDNNFYGAIPDSLANQAFNISMIGESDKKKEASIWISSKHDGIYFNTGNAPSERSWNDACDISKEVESFKKFIQGKQQYTIDKKKYETPVINDDGFFYARVEVCTKSANGMVEDYKDFNLCTQQPNGNFKPTGVIQKHANDLRIAAFGYALEHKSDSTLYGGVLRAPMRYVGPKTFDIYGRELSKPNPYAEWDPNTGIFYTNPYGKKDIDDGIALGPSKGLENSGVINYLNKFGRTGTEFSTSSTDKNAPNSDKDLTSTHYFGEYKFKDPISSLYYTVLRYLQGEDVMPESIKDLRDKSFDGFPIYTDWSQIDPFGDGRSKDQNYACLKTNIVTIGDIKAQEVSEWVPGGTSGKYKTIQQRFEPWRNHVTTKESFSKENTNKIIGYSFWAHANDIRGTGIVPDEKVRPGLRVKSFFFDVNEESLSSDIEKRSKNNPLYFAAKYGGYETDPFNPKGTYWTKNQADGTYPDPELGYPPGKADTTGISPTLNHNIWQRRSPDEINDSSIEKKARDPSTYYLQSDARSVLNAFNEIFSRVANNAQSIAQSDASGTSIKSGDQIKVYTANYELYSWAGDIVARTAKIDSASKDIYFEEDNEFRPAAALNQRNSDSRNIVLGLGNQSSPQAVNFKWDKVASTPAAQHLKKASISAAEDDLGEARLEYLRGSRLNEGRKLGDTTFRIRKSVLGDIINAGVTYSGAPAARYADSDYQEFFKNNKARIPIVITGANDGMLHAFAAENQDVYKKGDEVFAYIPSWLTPKLSSLVDSEYINNHQAFVDAPSAVGEAKFITSKPGWKTVLVSGTGGGGRGVFALDITDPSQFSPSSVLWEFTHEDDEDLGYVLGKPKILKFKVGADKERWFAAVASGVNNYQSNYESSPGSARPSLFLLALDKPDSEDWSRGVNYFKVSFPVDEKKLQTMPSGLIDFSPLLSTDGYVTHIYAGDLHGNLWKLDFTSNDKDHAGFKPSSAWSMGNLSAFKSKQPAPLYQAKNDETSAFQPISSAPLVINGPIINGSPTYFIAFGTGKYIEEYDINNIQQSFHVIYDNHSGGTKDIDRSSYILSGKRHLQQASIDRLNNQITIPPFTWGMPKNDDEAETVKSGWYFDFPHTSERSTLQPNHIYGTSFSFNTLIPDTNPNNQNVCGKDDATSNTYFMDINAGGKYTRSNIGILSQSLFLINEEKETTSEFDSTGRAKRKVHLDVINPGVEGIETSGTSYEEIIGRLSWRQIHNYKELRHRHAASLSE